MEKFDSIFEDNIDYLNKNYFFSKYKTLYLKILNNNINEEEDDKLLILFENYINIFEMFSLYRSEILALIFYKLFSLYGY